MSEVSYLKCDTCKKKIEDRYERKLFSAITVVHEWTEYDSEVSLSGKDTFHFCSIKCLKKNKFELDFSGNAE